MFNTDFNISYLGNTWEQHTPCVQFICRKQINVKLGNWPVCALLPLRLFQPLQFFLLLLFHELLRALLVSVLLLFVAFLLLPVSFFELLPQPEKKISDLFPIIIGLHFHQISPTAFTISISPSILLAKVEVMGGAKLS